MIIFWSKSRDNTVEKTKGRVLPCVPHKAGPAGNIRAPSGVNDNFIRRCQECLNAEGHTFNTACNKG